MSTMIARMFGRRGVSSITLLLNSEMEKSFCIRGHILMWLCSGGLLGPSLASWVCPTRPSAACARWAANPRSHAMRQVFLGITKIVLVKKSFTFLMALKLFDTSVQPIKPVYRVRSLLRRRTRMSRDDASLRGTPWKCPSKQPHSSGEPHLHNIKLFFIRGGHQAKSRWHNVAACDLLTGAGSSYRATEASAAPWKALVVSLGWALFASCMAACKLYGCNSHAGVSLPECACRQRSPRWSLV
jgi:hypothetical protein